MRGLLDVEPEATTCSVEGCSRRKRARGWCHMHWKRWRRNGDLGQAESTRGNSSINYRRIKIPDHPLACSDGWVSEHRAVLYSKVGPGQHPCHWCGKQLTWQRGLACDAIEADHVDFNIHNNAPDNIVASCHSCNVKRSSINIRPDELHVVFRDGRKARAVQRTCDTCGSSFLLNASELKRKNARAGRYCSHECQWRRNKGVGNAAA